MNHLTKFLLMGILASIAACGSGSKNHRGENTPLPVISISKASVDEGHTGASTLEFVVSLSGVRNADVSMDYITSDGTAIAGEDYTADSGSLLIPAGQAEAVLSIEVLADTLFEVDETLSVTLANPVNATLATASASGTIVNDDVVPNISIADASAAEGDGSAGSLAFVVNLDTPAGADVTVDYASADGSAMAGHDYAAASGSLLIPAGQAEAVLSIEVLADTLFEVDETLSVTLANPVNATLATASASGTITNDDTMPVVSISDVSAPEGNGGGPSALDFDVMLDNVSGVDVTVDYTTTDDTAVSTTDGSNDFTGGTFSVTIPAGQSSASASVKLHADMVSETDENFSISLNNPVNALLGNSNATGTIQNDDSVTRYMALGRRGFDLVFASDTRAYACAIFLSADNSRLNEKVFVYEFDVPSGDILRSVEITESEMVSTCELELNESADTLIVAYSKKVPVGLTAAMKLLTIDTFASSAESVGNGITFQQAEPILKVARVGTNYLMVMNAETDEVAVSAFNGLPDFAQMGITVNISLALEVHMQQLEIAVVGGLVSYLFMDQTRDIHVQSNHSDPVNPKVIFSTLRTPMVWGFEPGFAAYHEYVLDQNGNWDPNKTLLHTRGFVWDIDVLGGYTRILAPAYRAPGATPTSGQHSYLGLLGAGDVTPNVSPYQPTQVDLGDGSMPMDYYFLNTGYNLPDPADTIADQYTMDGLLYQNQDWIIAMRNKDTSKLNLHRIPVDYSNYPGIATGDPGTGPMMNATPMEVDVTFCGNEGETTGGLDGVFRANNFVEVRELSNGKLAVAYVSCNDPALDPTLNLIVVDAPPLP